MQAEDVGVDVSARELVVAIRRSGERVELLRFTNDAEGHGKLVRRVTRRGRSARVVLESTGVYSPGPGPRAAPGSESRGDGGEPEGGEGLR
jgi:transposase